MKAYEVREPDEGHCVIVFATRSVVARREGSNELDITFGEVDQCKRLPWADSYAPGPVPLKDCIEIGGWWSTCACGCDRRIDNEGGRGNMDLDGDDGELNPMEPVYVGRGVYWNQKCKDNDEREKRERAEAKVRDQAEAEAAVLAKFPFATDIESYRSYGTVDGKKYGYDVLGASFAFPGGRFHAHWSIGAKSIRVQAEDQHAWGQQAAGSDAGVSE